MNGDLEICTGPGCVIAILAKIWTFLPRAAFQISSLTVFLAIDTNRTTDLALIGAKVYPSPTDPPIANGSILIRDGHILAVGPSQTIKIPHGES
jgi:hypothetical protein